MRYLNDVRNVRLCIDKALQYQSKREEPQVIVSEKHKLFSYAVVGLAFGLSVYLLF